MGSKVIDTADKVKRKNPLTRCESVFLTSYRTLRRLWQKGFTSVTLVTLLVSFLLVWATIFLDLEAESEEESTCARERKLLLNEIWNASKGNFDDFMKEANDLLDNQKPGCSDDAFRHWTFAGSLFYSTSIASTIGYGRITPSTVRGKWATICFVFMAIPLFNITVKNLAECFRKCLNALFGGMARVGFKCIRAICRKSKRENEDLGLYLCDQDTPYYPFSYTVVLLTFVLTGSMVYACFEASASYFDCFFNIFISLATVGFSEDLIKNKGLLVAAVFFNIVGLAMISLCIEAIEDRLSRFLKSRIEKLKSYVFHLETKSQSTTEEDSSDEAMEA